jgi:hypothetical protein
MRKLSQLLFVVLLMFMMSSCAFAATRTVGENFQASYIVLDSSGDFVTGQSPTVAIKKVSSGAWYDFSSSTFKTSGWTNKTTALTEDSTNKLYLYTFTPPGSETTADQYLFVIANADATYKDQQTLSVDYLNLSSGSAPTAAQVADAVWDETISGHLTSGTTGAKLNDASAAGNPWTTDISTGYTGQAGEYLRNVQNATDGDKESGAYTGIETLIRSSR